MGLNSFAAEQFRPPLFAARAQMREKVGLRRQSRRVAARRRFAS